MNEIMVRCVACGRSLWAVRGSRCVECIHLELAKQERYDVLVGALVLAVIVLAATTAAGGLLGWCLP